MAKVSVYNIEGKEVDTIELNDAVFGVEVNEHLVHMAVVNQLANNRQGTQKAKTRSEVSGGEGNVAELYLMFEAADMLRVLLILDFHLSYP